MASSTTPAQKIGYIGLGHAGYPLASHLHASGYHLVVRDADPTRASAFASEHRNAIAAAPNDAKAFGDVDVLVTMLPNGEVVREVLLGSEGVAAYLKPGAVVVDTSSSSPHHTRETAEMLAEVNSEVTLIDSPVTQAYAHALAKGDATLMVS